MPDTAVLTRKPPRINKKKAAIMSLTMNVASVALAIEAIEELLLEKGILKDDELLQKLEKVTKAHYSKGEFIPQADD